MRKIYTGLSALALTSMLGACATVTRGSNEQFSIQTIPPAAEAHTTTGFNCEATPCSIRMPRKDAFAITISKPGYKTATVNVEPKLAGNGAAGFLGNVLIGGVIGAAVDVGSGATMDLTPNPLIVTLEADAPAAVAANVPAPAPTALAANASPPASTALAATTGAPPAPVPPAAATTAAK